MATLLPKSSTLNPSGARIFLGLTNVGSGLWEGTWDIVGDEVGFELGFDDDSVLGAGVGSVLGLEGIGVEHPRMFKNFSTMSLTPIRSFFLIRVKVKIKLDDYN